MSKHYGKVRYGMADEIERHRYCQCCGEQTLVSQGEHIPIIIGFSEFKTTDIFLCKDCIKTKKYKRLEHKADYRIAEISSHYKK